MNPANLKLIRKHAGSKGGTAAAKRMTAQQRKARARKGGLARQAKVRMMAKTGVEVSLLQ